MLAILTRRAWSPSAAARAVCWRSSAPGAVDDAAPSFVYIAFDLVRAASAAPSEICRM